MDFKTKHEISLIEAFERYGDMLYRLALTHTSNREDAEDACQDVFIKYSQKPPSFADAEHAKAWFIRVCINRCRDLVRQRRIRTHLSMDEISEIIADSSLTDEYRELSEAIGELPVKYREVIILHYLEGFGIEECSEILHLSISAVKMRLMRARDMMKLKLTKED